MDPDAQTPVASFQASHAKEAELRAEIVALAEARRQIVASLYEGRSLAEVASLLGITRARVHQLVHR